MLIQQTSRFLLKNLQRIQKGKSIKSPFGTVQYLSDVSSILSSKCKANSQQDLSTDTIADALKFRACYYLTQGAKNVLTNIKSGVFHAFNNSQIFALHPAVSAHVEYLAYTNILREVPSVDPSIKNVLLKLANLFALNKIATDLGVFFEGGYFEPKHSKIIKQEVLRLCLELKDEAVALADAIAPPDQILWSALGQSDGQVYKHLMNKIVTAKEAFERPHYWRLCRTPVNVGSLRSKL